MKQFLIASHGMLASGLKSSIQILTGAGEKLQTIDAYLDDKPVDIGKEMDHFISGIDAKDAAVVFTDLVGGSVNREVLLRTEAHSNIFVISSVNLPTVLAVLLDTEELTKTRLESIIKSTQVELVSIDQNTSNDTDDIDDFLS